MHALGRLEDLPQDYRDALSGLNLVPLWPNLRALLPPAIPGSNTRPTHWPYATLRPLLMRAGELTPMEKAERRVLVLANPGHGLENMKASPAMYLGMQLLLPGEWAPAHRHTPNAARIIVEGRGATTTVSGEKCPMEHGDLILTPTGQWHEHGHDGDGPVVWLDVLDLPLMVYTETSYADEGQQQVARDGRGDQVHTAGGVVPAPLFERDSQKAYPMLRYPWSAVRQALITMADDRPALEAVQVGYINPKNGQDVQNNLGFYALMLRPGQTLTLPARSPSAVYHVIEGGCEISGEDLPTMSLSEADTCVVPGYTASQIRNCSLTAPAFVFIADEAPLHRKLGVYEVRNAPAQAS